MVAEDAFGELNDRVDELQARLAANDMLMKHLLLPILMSALGDEVAEHIVAGLRGGHNISVSPDVDDARREGMTLVVNDHLNGIADQIERSVRPVSSGFGTG